MTAMTRRTQGPWRRASRASGARARIAVLASGGVDSTALLWWLQRRGWEVVPLYIRSGFVWETAELFWLRRCLARLDVPQPVRVVSLPADEVPRDHWALTGVRVPGVGARDAAVYLPGRNALMVTKAAVVCVAARLTATVAVGVLKGNPFSDARPGFFRALERSLTAGLGERVRVWTPFRQVSKREVLQMGQGVPWHLTLSCLRPRLYDHCGRCQKCGERRRAFHAAGLHDPAMGGA